MKTNLLTKFLALFLFLNYLNLQSQIRNDFEAEVDEDSGILLESLTQDDVPFYYQLIQSGQSNIYDISDEFEKYYDTHEFEKNEFSRAYFRYSRNLADNNDLFENHESTFQDHPLLKTGSNENIVGPDWRNEGVRIYRDRCQGAGQLGVVLTIAICPSNSNIVLISAGGGIYRTTDKGRTWSENLFGKTLRYSGAPSSIVFSRSNPRIVYAHCRTGVIKSTDYGLTWFQTSRNSGKGGGFVAVAPTNPSRVIATYRDNDNNISISVSNNGGSTWNDFYLGHLRNISDLKYHPTNNNIAYATVKNPVSEDPNVKFGFYRTTNGGVTWNKITNAPFANYNGVKASEQHALIAVSPAQPNLVMLYFSRNSEGQGFFKSTNSGYSFTKVCCGGPNAPLINQSTNLGDFRRDYGSAQVGWCTAFAMSDVNANIIAAATNKYPKWSNNLGSSWWFSGDFSQPQERGRNHLNLYNDQGSCSQMMHTDIQAIAIQGNDVWVANDGGIVYSPDLGKTYYERGDGLAITPALGFDMTQGGSRDVMVAALDHNGVIVYDRQNYGLKWRFFGGGDAGHASLNPIDDFTLFADVPRASCVVRPEEVWGNKSVFNPGRVNFGSGYGQKYVNVQFHPTLYNTLFFINYKSINTIVNGKSLVKSIDGGRTYLDVMSFEPSMQAVYLKISNSNPDRMYMVANYGKRPNKLYRSYNGGLTWYESNLDELTSNAINTYTAFDVDGNNPNVLWVAGIKGKIPKVYKSTDGGATFFNYSKNLPTSWPSPEFEWSIQSMIHQRGTDGGIYIGTNNGVYYTDNNLSNYVRYGDNLNFGATTYLKIHYGRNLIRAVHSGINKNSLYKKSDVKAIISMSDNRINCGDSIQFAASNSILKYNKSTRYEWEFEGGTPRTSNRERQKVFYKVPGVYSVKLTVKEDKGKDTQVLEKYITVTSIDCEDAIDIEALSFEPENGSINCNTTQNFSLKVVNRSNHNVNRLLVKVFKNNSLFRNYTINRRFEPFEEKTIRLNNVNLNNAWKLEAQVMLNNGQTDDIPENDKILYRIGEPIKVNSFRFHSSSTHDAVTNSVGARLLDSNLNSKWQANFHGAANFPYILNFRSNTPVKATGIYWLNRQDELWSDSAKDILIEASIDGSNWVSTPSMVENTNAWQYIPFNGLIGFKYLRIKILNTHSGGRKCAIAELQLSGCHNQMSYRELTMVSAELDNQSLCAENSAITATIKNTGMVRVPRYNVELYINDQLIRSRAITQGLNANGTKVVVFNNEDISNAWKIETKVTVNGAEDLNTDINTAIAYKKGVQNLPNNFATYRFTSFDAPSNMHPNNMIDGNPNTIWHSGWHGTLPSLPYSLEFRTPENTESNGLYWLNRQDNPNITCAKEVEIATSQDGNTWSTFKTEIKPIADWQFIPINGVNTFRYVRINVLSTQDGINKCAIAEIALSTCDSQISNRNLEIELDQTSLTQCDSDTPIKVNIINIGDDIASNYTVELYTNDKLVNTKTITQSLNAKESNEIIFENIDLSNVWKIEAKIHLEGEDDTKLNQKSSVLYNNAGPIEVSNITGMDDTVNKKMYTNLFDNKTSTLWQSNAREASNLPYELSFNINNGIQTTGLFWQNREDQPGKNSAKDIEIQTSKDGVNWSSIKTTIEPIAGNQFIPFDGTQGINFIKIIVHSTQDGNPNFTISELKFAGCSGSSESLQFDPEFTFVPLKQVNFKILPAKKAVIAEN